MKGSSIFVREYDFLDLYKDRVKYAVLIVPSYTHLFSIYKYEINFLKGIDVLFKTMWQKKHIYIWGTCYPMSSIQEKL